MVSLRNSLPTASLIDWSIDQLISRRRLLWIFITIIWNFIILLVDSKGFTERNGATDQDQDGSNELLESLPKGVITEGNDMNLQNQLGMSMRDISIGGGAKNMMAVDESDDSNENYQQMAMMTGKKRRQPPPELFSSELG